MTFGIGTELIKNTLGVEIEDFLPKQVQYAGYSWEVLSCFLIALLYRNCTRNNSNKLENDPNNKLKVAIALHEKLTDPGTDDAKFVELFKEGRKWLVDNSSLRGFFSYQVFERYIRSHHEIYNKRNFAQSLNK